MTIKYFKDKAVLHRATTYEMHYNGLFYGNIISYKDLVTQDVYWKSDQSNERFKTQEEAAKDLIGTDYSEEN